MRVSIGSDHRGIQVKAKLIPLLKELGHDVHDVGTNGNESVDYPDYAKEVASQVSTGKADRGILICGTGIGMSIAANKVPGVRAANCHDEHTAEMSRRHNDVNVLCLSSIMNDDARIAQMTKIWLATEFEGGRHARRVEKISALDKNKGEATSQ
jgi:ribose 5-phosphate isomerase B